MIFVSISQKWDITWGLQDTPRCPVFIQQFICLFIFYFISNYFWHLVISNQPIRSFQLETFFLLLSFEAHKPLDHIATQGKQKLIQI
jgi:hypothetical protein